MNIESSEAHKILDHDDMACALGLVTPSSENTIYGTESTTWSTQATVQVPRTIESVFNKRGRSNSDAMDGRKRSWNNMVEDDDDDESFLNEEEVDVGEQDDEDDEKGCEDDV